MINRQTPCFIYIHSSILNGSPVCKVGITNNIKKRLNEFNGGLRYRERHYPIIRGVVFSNVASKIIINRVAAEKIERKIKSLLANRLIPEFGREVFRIDKGHAERLMLRIISENDHDQD